MVVYYLPIEPLNERYTEQWYRWFPAAFVEAGVPCIVLDGSPLLNDEIKVGTFLDINSTLHYKAEQLKKVADFFHRGLVKAGDCFFVADIEFFGIEAIRYLSVLNKIPVRIVGFAHAGSYTVGDFMEPCSDFAHVYERGWGLICDAICVGTEYHKRRLVSFRNFDHPDRVVVTGNPYDFKEIRTPDREAKIARKKKRRSPFTVVHTNRPDPEKNPNTALSVFEILASQRGDCDFVITTGRKQWGSGDLRNRAKYLEERGFLTIEEGIAKQTYLDILADASVMLSCSLEENFGYCVLEAAAMGCIPVLPNCASHPELLRKVKHRQDLLYAPGADPEEIAHIVERTILSCSLYSDVDKVVDLYENSLKRIVEVCLSQI